MKTILLIFCILTVALSRTFAIEGLTISVDCPNVVLGWPSDSNSGETFIVQYRASLSTNDAWQTLTNFYPASTETNWTIFVHSNQVTCNTNYSGGGTNVGGDGPPSPGSFSSGSFSEFSRESYPPLPSLPPLPWEPGSISKTPGSSGRVEFSSETEDAEGDGVETGFYQVVRNGVHILDAANLTNEVLSGTVPVSFEAGNTVGPLVCAVIFIDGVKFAGDGVLSAPLAYPWRFQLDTAFLENGTHALQIEATWYDVETDDENNLYPGLVSDPVYITVTNQVYYPQWEPEIGETDIAPFFFKTVDPDATFEINISNTNGILLQTLTGQATNGVIEAYWDLRDTNNAAHTNASVDPELLSTITIHPGQTNATTVTAPKKRQREKNWPDEGKWVVAYQDMFKFDYSEDDEMQDSINTFAGIAGGYGGYVLYYPQPGQTNDVGQTYPLRYQKANHMDTNITPTAIAKDDSLLLNFLGRTNSRNFFYIGHGSDDEIAGFVSSKRIPIYVKHRYRFVFLHGCSTANGDLDKAFGINGPGTYPLSHYQATGIRPAAFCGYNVNPLYLDNVPLTVNGKDYDGTIPWQVPGFISNFLFYWHLYSTPLDDAITDAKNDLPRVSGWPLQLCPGQGMVIHGYNRLGIGEYNHKSDWP